MGTLQFTYQPCADIEQDETFMPRRTQIAQKMLGWHFPEGFVERVIEKRKAALIMLKVREKAAEKAKPPK